MKTPKEEAQELFIEFYSQITGLDNDYIIKNLQLLSATAIREDSHWKTAKQCAIIAVDRILDLIKGHDFLALERFYNEVKQEINLL